MANRAVTKVIALFLFMEKEYVLDHVWHIVF